eukprot:Colp12_sorted_trinity150504_noHs@8053
MSSAENCFNMARGLLLGLLLCSVAFVQGMPLVRSSCENIHDLQGFLIDLDGTMWIPGGLVDGAQKFFDWLQATNKPYVFLSNTGAKGPLGVSVKFSTPPFKISDDRIPLENIYTAANAAADYLVQNAPMGANIFLIEAISHYGNTTDSFWKVLQSVAPQVLFNSWNIRLDLSYDEVKEWARHAKQNPGSTFVVTGADGPVESEADPVTGEKGYIDWNFDLLSHARIIIANGGIFVNTARVYKRMP